MKDNKYLSLVITMAYAVGSIGGVGHTLHIHEYVIAACIAVLAVMAFPMFWKHIKNLNS